MDGRDGRDGARGPTGPAGTVLIPFLHSVSHAQQTVCPGDPVALEPRLLANKPGYYQLSYTLFYRDPCQFTIFVNGAPAPNTTIGSPDSSSHLSATFVLFLHCTSHIEIVNHRSFAPVRLGGTSGTVDGQLSAVATLLFLRERRT